MRGRKPSGPEYVDKLDGSTTSKERVRVILETLAGRLRLHEACTQLGIGENRFHQLRQEALQAALDGLQPQPLGRPRVPRTAADQRLEALEGRLAVTEWELHTAQVREEVALIGVREAPPAAPGKKTRRRRVKVRRLRPR